MKNKFNGLMKKSNLILLVSVFLVMVCVVGGVVGDMSLGDYRKAYGLTIPADDQKLSNMPPEQLASFVEALVSNKNDYSEIDISSPESKQTWFDVYLTRISDISFNDILWKKMTSDQTIKLWNNLGELPDSQLALFNKLNSNNANTFFKSLEPAKQTTLFQGLASDKQIVLWDKLTYDEGFKLLSEMKDETSRQKFIKDLNSKRDGKELPRDLELLYAALTGKSISPNIKETFLNSLAYKELVQSIAKKYGTISNSDSPEDMTPFKNFIDTLYNTQDINSDKILKKFFDDIGNENMQLKKDLILRLVVSYSMKDEEKSKAFRIFNALDKNTDNDLRKYFIEQIGKMYFRSVGQTSSDFSKITLTGFEKVDKLELNGDLLTAKVGDKSIGVINTKDIPADLGEIKIGPGKGVYDKVRGVIYYKNPSSGQTPEQRSYVFVSDGKFYVVDTGKGGEWGVFSGSDKSLFNAGSIHLGDNGGTTVLVGTPLSENTKSGIHIWANPVENNANYPNGPYTRLSNLIISPHSGTQAAGDGRNYASANVKSPGVINVYGNVKGISDASGYTNLGQTEFSMLVYGTKDAVLDTTGKDSTPSGGVSKEQIIKMTPKDSGYTMDLNGFNQGTISLKVPSSKKIAADSGLVQQDKSNEYTWYTYTGKEKQATTPRVPATQTGQVTQTTKTTNTPASSTLRVTTSSLTSSPPATDPTATSQATPSPIPTPTPTPTATPTPSTTVTTSIGTTARRTCGPEGCGGEEERVVRLPRVKKLFGK